MDKTVTLKNIYALIANLLLVYVAYAICRILFIVCNLGLYPDLTFSRALELMAAGLVFDSSAIFYSNAIIILMYLFPLHLKERRGYYTTAHWIYVAINALCIIPNLCDIVYFRFTGKRTTASVFAEFAHEGAGNLANVFIDQIARNWWLVFAFIALVAMLWWGFRSPLRPLLPFKAAKSSAPKRISLSVYYPTMVVALALMAGFTIGMMRGGFTHAVRPITISNATKYANTPAEAGIVLNTPFAMMRTIGTTKYVVPDYMPQAQADALFNPLVTPVCRPDSLTAKDYNVVIIIMESFSKQHIGFFNVEHDENGPEGDKHTFTPFLDSLLTDKALSFRYSYANGRRSIDAMPSVLSSIPSFVEPFFLTPASLNDISGIARELSENRGYASSFFHGAENGSMGFEAFANASGFQRYYGRTEYNADKRYGGDRDFDGTWAIWDEEFMQFYADCLTDMPQPFVSALFTASSHTPFTLPARYEGAFPDGKHPLQRCIAYTDNALRLFFEKASKQPWYDRTIFVITADHSSGEVDPFYLTISGHYAVPIVLYAPGLPWLKGYDQERIAQQIDIMPTLLGLLGYDKPYVAFGKDLLDTPAADTWAIRWVPENQSYEFVADRYLLRFDGEKLTQAFDYRTDLLQKHDILDQIPDSVAQPMEQKLKAIVQQYMLSMTSNAITAKTRQK